MVRISFIEEFNNYFIGFSDAEITIIDVYDQGDLEVLTMEKCSEFQQLIIKLISTE
jgi:hypothetical protein